MDLQVNLGAFPTVRWNAVGQFLSLAIFTSVITWGMTEKYALFIIKQLEVVG